jgi:hypothetical protein
LQRGVLLRIDPIGPFFLRNSLFDLLRFRSTDKVIGSF